MHVGMTCTASLEAKSCRLCGWLALEPQENVSEHLQKTAIHDSRNKHLKI